MKNNEYIEKLDTGKTITLSDDKTKLYVLAKNDLYIIKVDNGIIKNTKVGIKKCDYMIYDENNAESHFIELKGAEIKAAFEQIEKTIQNDVILKEYEYLLNKKNRVDAFVVSPLRRNIPSGIDSMERKLTGFLAKKCKIKPKNVLELLKYVRVVPNGKRLVIKDREVECSGRYPLPLPLNSD